MRAAIYARFSSDLQNERSIDDQVSLCRTYAKREGLTVTATYDDRALSGMSIIGRQGLARLMEDAKARRFDVVIVEALDRLARDSEDLSHLYKRLSFAGIEIRGVHDGRADAVQIGVRGLLGSLYVTDLAHKVRRGFMGRAREGKHPSGKAYGYTVPDGKRGERQIVPAEAAVVRRIYDAYLDGATPRAIAGMLNREGISPPRGRAWNASTINGSRQRQNGILHNELYHGLLVWNRLRMVKDPDTGRRVSRLNPESEWVKTAVPELAIVDKATWDAVQDRTAGRAKAVLKDARAPRYFLSGLLKCGSCGGGMSARGASKTGKRRFQCSRFTESGSCAHSRIYQADAVESAVVGLLRDELRHPTVIAAYVEEYQDERRRLAADAGKERGRVEARLGEVRRTLDRLVDQIADGSIQGKTVADRLATLEAEREGLEGQLTEMAAPAEVIALHPAAVARFAAQTEALAREIADCPAGVVEPGTPAHAVREVLQSVVVRPSAVGAPLDLEILGKLAVLLGSSGLIPDPGKGCRRGGSSGRIHANLHPHDGPVFSLRVRVA